MNNYSQQKKSRKGLGVIALLGVCAISIATMIGTWDAPRSAISDEAAMAHLNSLVEQHKYFAEQHGIIGELIEEGVENQVAIAGAMAAISQAATFAKTAGPLVQGVASIAKNLIWGSGVAVKTVDVKKIDSAFNDSKVFVAEIKKRFPNSYQVIAGLRQKLKVYQLDLSNIIQDLSLMADSTENETNITLKTLGVRTKMFQKAHNQGEYKDDPRYKNYVFTGEKDAKVWKRAIKQQLEGMAQSIEKCDVIIKALGALQKAVKACNDELETEIDNLRKALEASNQQLKHKLEQIEAKLKKVGCVNNGKELLRAIFTLGLACLLGQSDTKKEMLNVQADLKEEQTIIQAISKRMNYFDDLLGSAATLVKESEGVMQTTKSFKQGLVQAQNVLLRDYTPEEIDDNLGDVDFANDFAMELEKTLHQLIDTAQKVSADCIDRKHRLDAALTGINKYFGEEEEEIVELEAAVADAAVGAQFNKVSDDCSDYFDAVSQDVFRIQNGYITKIIGLVQKVKDTLLLKNKDGYSGLKIQLFTVLDKARDVQLKIESAQYRLQNNAEKINRYIGRKGVWYYQHKYAVKSGTYCLDDKKLIDEELATLTEEYTKFHAEMLPALGKSVSVIITNEYKAAGAAVQAKKAEFVPKPTDELVDLPMKPSRHSKLYEDAKDGDEEAKAKYEAMADAYNTAVHHNMQVRIALKKWTENEEKRSAQEEYLQGQAQEAMNVINKFNPYYQAMKTVSAPEKRNDKITQWPATLSAEIAQFQADSATVIPGSKARNQTDAENKAAIARNEKSSNLAKEHMDETKKRGATVVEVKSKLIW